MGEELGFRLQHGARCLFVFGSRLSGAQDAQCMATTVFERLDCSGDFQDAIADGVESVRLISAGEEFGFNHTGPIGQGKKFHGFTGDLMKEALLDDQSAGDNLLANMLSEAVDGAVGVPGNIRVEFERVAADRIADEFFFGAEALEAVGLGQGHGG